MLACAAGIALGHWQSGRAQQKRAQQAGLERISVTGIFVPQYTVLLDNKQRNRRPGYEVVTPLRLSNSDMHLLIDRGWIAAPPTRDVLPEVRTPEREVRVEGRVLNQLPRIFSLEQESKSRVRQTLEIPSFAAETGLKLRPYFLEQYSSTDDGLLREWPRADAGVEKHESYALQWYSLAALAAVLGLVFSFRKK